jgi:hypothetical protein
MSAPELIFRITTRVYQWLFFHQNGYGGVDKHCRPKEKHQANQRNNAYRADPKIGEFGQSRAYAEYPAILPVSVVSAR